MKFWVKAVVDRNVQEQLLVAADSLREVQEELEKLLDIRIGSMSITDFQRDVVDQLNDTNDIIKIVIRTHSFILAAQQQQQQQQQQQPPQSHFHPSQTAHFNSRRSSSDAPEQAAYERHLQGPLSSRQSTSSHSHAAQYAHRPKSSDAALHMMMTHSHPPQLTPSPTGSAEGLHHGFSAVESGGRSSSSTPATSGAGMNNNNNNNNNNNSIPTTTASGHSGSAGLHRRFSATTVGTPLAIPAPNAAGSANHGSPSTSAAAAASFKEREREQRERDNNSSHMLPSTSFLEDTDFSYVSENTSYRGTPGGGVGGAGGAMEGGVDGNASKTTMDISPSVTPPRIGLNKKSSFLDNPAIEKICVTRDNILKLLHRRMHRRYVPVLTGCFARVRELQGYFIYQISEIEPDGKIIFDRIYSNDKRELDTISNANPMKDELNTWMKKMLLCSRPYPTNGFIEAKHGDLISALRTATASLQPSSSYDSPSPPPVPPPPSASGQDPVSFRVAGRLSADFLTEEHQSATLATHHAVTGGSSVIESDSTTPATTAVSSPSHYQQPQARSHPEGMSHSTNTNSSTSRSVDPRSSATLAKKKKKQLRDRIVLAESLSSQVPTQHDNNNNNSNISNTSSSNHPNGSKRKRSNFSPHHMGSLSSHHHSRGSRPSSSSRQTVGGKELSAGTCFPFTDGVPRAAAAVAAAMESGDEMEEEEDAEEDDDEGDEMMYGSRTRKGSLVESEVELAAAAAASALHATRGPEATEIAVDPSTAIDILINSNDVADSPLPIPIGGSAGANAYGGPPPPRSLSSSSSSPPPMSNGVEGASQSRSSPDVEGGSGSSGDNATTTTTTGTHTTAAPVEAATGTEPHHLGVDNNNNIPSPMAVAAPASKPPPSPCRGNSQSSTATTAIPTAVAAGAVDAPLPGGGLPLGAAIPPMMAGGNNSGLAASTSEEEPRTRRLTALRPMLQSCFPTGKMSVKLNDLLSYIHVQGGVLPACAAPSPAHHAVSSNPRGEGASGVGQELPRLLLSATRHSNCTSRGGSAAAGGLSARSRRSDFAGCMLTLDPVGNTVIRDRDITEKGYALYTFPIRWGDVFVALGQLRPVTDDGPYVEDSVSQFPVGGATGGPVSSSASGGGPCLVQQFTLFRGPSADSLYETSITKLPLPSFCGPNPAESYITQVKLVVHRGNLHAFYVVRHSGGGVGGGGGGVDGVRELSSQSSFNSANTLAPLDPAATAAAAAASSALGGTPLALRSLTVLPRDPTSIPAGTSAAAAAAAPSGMGSSPPLTRNALAPLDASALASADTSIMDGSSVQSISPFHPHNSSLPGKNRGANMGGNDTGHGDKYSVVHAICMNHHSSGTATMDGLSSRSMSPATMMMMMGGGAGAGAGGYGMGSSSAVGLEWKILTPAEPLFTTTEEEPIFTVASLDCYGNEAAGNYGHFHSHSHSSGAAGSNAEGGVESSGRPSSSNKSNSYPMTITATTTTNNNSNSSNIRPNHKPLSPPQSGDAPPTGVTGVSGGGGGSGFSSTGPAGSNTSQLNVVWVSSSAALSHNNSPRKYLHPVRPSLPKHREGLNSRALLPFQRLTNASEGSSFAHWREDYLSAANRVDPMKVRQDIRSISLFEANGSAFITCGYRNEAKLSLWTIPLLHEL